MKAPLRPTRIYRLLGLAAALLLVGGCSQQDRVAGRVTFGGAPVKGGFVTFIGPDNRRRTADINGDGEYQFLDHPSGTVKVGVAGVVADPSKSTAARPVPKDVHGAPRAPATTTPLPRKYADPDNGLTFDVTGGSQKFDIELTP
jgi:hypothetical protein